MKPNTGHLEGGAGVVGLIKTVLALHHEMLPPTAGLGTLSTAVDWAASGLRVPTEAEPWPRGAEPRRAAVCSYGYGGTIAHVLIEDAPEVVRPDAAEARAVVIPLSARSEARLAQQASALADHLRASEFSVDRVAATMWTRRSHEPVRGAVVTDGIPDTNAVIDALDAMAAPVRDPRMVTGAAVPGAENGAVWVFSGHGSHWAGMGRELLATEPAFAATIDEIDVVFRRELGFSARDALTAEQLGGTDQVQALTFAMQVGPRRRAARARGDARGGARPLGRRGRGLRGVRGVRPCPRRVGRLLPGARLPGGRGRGRDGLGAAAVRGGAAPAARARGCGGGHQCVGGVHGGVGHGGCRR